MNFMNIFKNKRTKRIRIYCYLDETKKVKELAEKHLADKSVVEVRAHGCLLNSNVRVTITFKTRDKISKIYRDFLEEFKNYSINIRKRNIFIYKEVGPN